MKEHSISFSLYEYLEMNLFINLKKVQARKNVFRIE
jgi:hypothetical protein